jgi:hypothetical protein
MQINNLSDRERLIADLLWSRNGTEEIKELLMNLPPEDQHRARALVALMKMGGDAVDNTQDATRVIDKFRL